MLTLIIACILAWFVATNWQWLLAGCTRLIIGLLVWTIASLVLYVVLQIIVWLA